MDGLGKLKQKKKQCEGGLLVFWQNIKKKMRGLSFKKKLRCSFVLSVMDFDNN